MRIQVKFILFSTILGILTNSLLAQQFDRSSTFRVIGYFASQTVPIDSFEVEHLTHLIFCFGGLRKDAFHIYNLTDSATIRKMVSLKQRNPKLKVLLSLGGWGGCADCSQTFSTAEGRVKFANSVKEITEYFKTDGIDLDWEYPVVQGYPGHARSPEDKNNFTELLKELRLNNKSPFQISFAAGGYAGYLDSAIDWRGVMTYVDFINVMSYDLVHGYSKISGHHTPLYSTSFQKESTDNAVQWLVKHGIPSDKIIIGAAFYGRYFLIDSGFSVGLNQPCHFSHAFSFKHASDSISPVKGFIQFWDSIAMAPFAIHSGRRLLATYDDERSVRLKTRYARDQHLGGIMFWQLVDDKFRKGLLDVIVKNIE